MYHCKPITITSAAHNGIQTRQDLPVDLDHFKNFNTTTQDAFCVSDVDLSANRILYGAKPSQLSFGDTSRQTNYNTIHNSSFVGHSVLPHKLQKGQTNKSQILKSDGKTTYEIDKFSHYTTTLSDTFKGVQNTPEQLAYNPIVNQQNGRSHIQFGESNMLQNSVTESVTKRDFIPLSHGFDSHAKKPINTDGMNKSMKPETNLKMKDRSFQEVCYSSGKKANPNPLPSGIQTVCYGRENSGDMLSNKHTYLSSVPEGDANLRLCGTTTQKDFLVHPVIRRKEEYNDKITHSSVFEGTFDSSTDDKYRTTSHIQYRAIDPYLAKLTRGTPVNPYVRMQQLGDGVNYGIDTTHTHHYKNPRQQGRRKPHIPLVAESNKLFPLTKLGLHPYTTTMDEYYGIEKAH
ncbi:hypothetical protein BC833DRAFT_611225 [Globomyces pollinis-pini]|nr:hypothetical protein BC833DRAFT_611225 [Globomyces pollinis-pini]